MTEDKGEIEEITARAEAMGLGLAKYPVEQVRSLLTQLTEAEAALPTVGEAMAYAKGYEEGLRDAKEQDVAKLIIERDTAAANLTFEKVLRQAAERSCDELKARLATLPKEGTSHPEHSTDWLTDRTEDAYVAPRGKKGPRYDQ